MVLQRWCVVSVGCIARPVLDRFGATTPAGRTVTPKGIANAWVVVVVVVVVVVAVTAAVAAVVEVVGRWLWRWRRRNAAHWMKTRHTGVN